MFTTVDYQELTLTKFGGLITIADPRDLPPGASPQNWDVDYQLAGVQTRPGLTNPITSITPPPGTVLFEWIKSADLLGPTRLTIVQDSGGGLWQENIITSPGALTRFYFPILNGARAISTTVNQREYIALSDLVSGQDQPRQYDAVNLDRISQVGPGAGPSTTVISPEFPIISITEIFPAININSISWGASINLYTAQPASTNLYFLGAPNSTAFTTNLNIGAIVYVSGAGNLAGQNPNGTYVVTSIGSFTDVDGTYQYFGVTANVANSEFARGTAGGTYQQTPALIQLSTPIPLQDAVVGGTIIIVGSSVPQWNSTWKISQTPTVGQLLISATSLTSNVATYDYTLLSGEAPGWQPSFLYPMAAQIVSPAGDVWQITTPGTSGGGIPAFAGGTQVDGTATWTKQPGTSKVLVTVFNTNNGNGIFNVQNAVITSATQTTFTVAITSPNISSAAEEGQAVSGSGTALIIDPGTKTLGTGNPGVNPIFGNATGGNVLVLNPLVAPGQRFVVCMFLTRNGFITPASPPTTFFTTPETGSLTFTNLPIGPPNVIARIVAITLAGAGPGGPYFWIPQDVIVPGSAASLGISQTFNKTILNDNTSTSLGPITISDAVLSLGINISVEGNNLQQERELGECVKVVQWAGRTFFLGERTKNDQFVNLTFDGGSISGKPAGWTITSGISASLSLVTSQIFGQSLHITGASGNLVIDLFSPGLGTNWPVTIPLSSMGTTLGEFILPFNNPLWNSVPTDLILRIYPSNLGASANLNQGAYQTKFLLSPVIQPNTAYSLRTTVMSPLGTDIVIDRIEIFPTEEPVYINQVSASYAENTEAIDGVTGAIDTSILSSSALTNEFVFLNKLFLTSVSKTFSPIQSASEPGAPGGNAWQVDEISNAVGSLGPLAVDVGEEYVLVASENGAYIFDGGNHVKFTQEIQQVWDYIYSPSKKTIWVLNDLKEQRILIGVPLPTPNQWLPLAPANPTPATPNVILMCSVLGLPTGSAIADGNPVSQSMFGGQLIFHDMRRKWTIWQIPAVIAAWIDRPSGLPGESEQIWFGQAAS